MVKEILKDIQVLVLAAGKSTRIRPIAGDNPKPLMQIHGLSILERNLFWLVEFGVDQVWINLHYQPEKIKQRLSGNNDLKLKVSYSLEPEILGTAGGYKNLEKLWQNTTLVIYGDSLIRFDIEKFMENHLKTSADASVAIFDQEVNYHTAIAGGRVVVDNNRKIIDFVESYSGHETNLSPLINAGAYLIEPEVLQLIPTQTFFDFAKDLFPKMLKMRYNLQSYLIDGYCLGFDTPESYSKGLHLIDTGKIKLL